MVDSYADGWTAGVAYAVSVARQQLHVIRESRAPGPTDRRGKIVALGLLIEALEPDAVDQVHPTTPTAGQCRVSGDAVRDGSE